MADRRVLKERPMSRVQWFFVFLLVIGGILFQIPSHDRGVMDHGEGIPGAVSAHDSTRAGEVAESGAYRTVLLEVTGMT